MENQDLREELIKLLKRDKEINITQFSTPGGVSSGGYTSEEVKEEHYKILDRIEELSELGVSANCERCGSRDKVVSHTASGLGPYCQECAEEAGLC